MLLRVTTTNSSGTVDRWSALPETETRKLSIRMGVYCGAEAGDMVNAASAYELDLCSFFSSRYFETSSVMFFNHLLVQSLTSELEGTQRFALVFPALQNHRQQTAVKFRATTTETKLIGGLSKTSMASGHIPVVFNLDPISDVASNVRGYYNHDGCLILELFAYDVWGMTSDNSTIVDLADTKQKSSM